MLQLHTSTTYNRLLAKYNLKLVQLRALNCGMGKLDGPLMVGKRCFRYGALADLGDRWNQLWSCDCRHRQCFHILQERCMCCPRLEHQRLLLWRLLMSHGSQLALVPMANPATRTTGVHTTRTDHPSSRTTRAHTPPRKPQHSIWSGMATMDWGWMHWVRFLVFVIFRFSRHRASCSELVR